MTRTTKKQVLRGGPAVPREQDGPFRQAARDYFDQAIVPIPCGGDTGKRPLIRGFPSLSLESVRERLPRLVGQFGAANVGLSCGPSRIVVVDIDDATLLEVMVERFGSTPVVVRTPSGGFHLYYAARSQLRCANLRSEGLNVDVKAGGGLIIAPPSIKPATGVRYAFVEGSLGDLRDLPSFRSESLRTHRLSFARSAGGTSKSIGEGGRNNFLFRELLKQAHSCDDFDALLDVARTLNDFEFEASLKGAEVVSTAKSAWRYHQEGKNWVGSAPRKVLTQSEIMAYASNNKGGDALLLRAYLEGQHAKRAGPFALDRKAMAARNVLPGWTEWRYREAIRVLVEMGELCRVGGGRRRRNGTREPVKYELVQSVAAARRNTTQTVVFRDDRDEFE